MANRKNRPIIFDTDPGMGIPYADLDDNLALLFVAGSPELDTKLISIVAGNVPAHHGVQSIRVTLGFLTATIPVHMGSQRPLFRAYLSGSEVARTRMGTIEYRGAIGLTEEIHEVSDALCAIIRVLETASEPVTIVAIGPLTNIAILLHQRPDLHKRIESIVIMGGAIHCGGNITPFAEFNVWVDPEAANMVFRSKVPKVLVSLDTTTTVALTETDFDETLRHIGSSSFERYVRDAVRGWIEGVHKASGAREFHPHDPIAVAYLVQPELFTTVQMDINVDIQTGATMGRDDDKGSTSVCVSLDTAGFKQLFFQRLQRIGIA